MRKLILQIRYTIFSRSLCVRHLQTILPYSPYLHGIFTIYSNFTPHTRIYFCKAENFLLNWNLLFQFTSNYTVNNLRQLLHALIAILEYMSTIMLLFVCVKFRSILCIIPSSRYTFIDIDARNVVAVLQRKFHSNTKEHALQIMLQNL